MDWLSSFFSNYLTELSVAATFAVGTCAARLFKIKKTKNHNAPSLAPSIPPHEASWETMDKTGRWLLNATSRSIPVVGREKELAFLTEFVNGPERISLAVISGSGGRGKTRLALDLCDQMEREKAKWKKWQTILFPRGNNSE